MAYIAPASVLEHTLIQSFIGLQILLESKVRWEKNGFRVSFNAKSMLSVQIELCPWVFPGIDTIRIC